MSGNVTSITKKKVHRRYGIDLAKSFRYLEYYRDAYNDTVPLGQKNERLKNEYLLAEILIRLYRQEFLRWQESNDFQVEIDIAQMPLLATNNAFLARKMGKTKKTIQTYRKKLAKAGVLVPVGRNEDGGLEYSVHHGRTCDYELCINPRLLHIFSNLHTRRVSVAGVDDFHDITKNLRPTSTGTSAGTLTRTEQELLGEKNTGTPPEATPEPKPEPTSGTKPEPSVEAQEPEGQNGQGSQPPVQVQQEPEVPPAAEPDFEAKDRRLRQLQAYAGKLFNAARGWLYPNEHIDQAKAERVRRRIEELFGNAPEEKLLKIVNNYNHRLKLAQLHWHKQYGELPDIEAFFDKNNPNGFILTGEFEDDREKYPPPRRATYRTVKRWNRGPGRNGTGHIGDILNA